MIFITYIAFFLIGIYSIHILCFALGWKKLKIFDLSNHFEPINISIVVACRNEEKNILFLLNSLENQNYPREKMEIVLVNDHSTDLTPNIISDFIKDLYQFKLLELSENKSGKKDALALGIKHAVSNIILTTDADCIMSPDWLKTMVQYYIQNKSKILAGPVQLAHSRNIFQKMQALEFLSLMGSGAGAIGINKAILCNGANLLFEKSVYENCDHQKSVASGDDIFLMLHAKKLDAKSIHFCKSKHAIIKTKPADSIKEFFNQRIRWTSKSKAYRDLDIIFTAIIVSLLNLTLATLLIYLFIDLSFFKVFISLFIIKSIVDLFILIPVSGFFNQRKLIWFFIPLQFVYPFYIMFTVIFGLTGNFRWKERSFREKG